MRGIASLAVFGLLSFAAPVVAALYPPGDWYAGLAKPAWTPPSWLFGPVWTLLYVLIAFAGWRVWRTLTGGRGMLLALWGLQWLANGLWSLLFFGMQRPLWALVDIVVLLLAIGAFIGLAWRRHRTAAVLFLPYAAWVGFATVLNAAIVVLNR